MRITSKAGATIAVGEQWIVDHTQPLESDGIFQAFLHSWDGVRKGQYAAYYVYVDEPIPTNTLIEITCVRVVDANFVIKGRIADDPSWAGYWKFIPTSQEPPPSSSGGETVKNQFDAIVIETQIVDGKVINQEIVWASEVPILAVDVEKAKQIALLAAVKSHPTLNVEELSVKVRQWA